MGIGESMPPNPLEVWCKLLFPSCVLAWGGEGPYGPGTGAQRPDKSYYDLDFDWVPPTTG